MVKKKTLQKSHPLRRLFRRALDYGFTLHPVEKKGVFDYIEEHLLCEFLHGDNLYRIRDASGKSLEDIAEMLAEGNVLLNAQSLSREFQVHKHIGDYTLFMLGMFPSALSRRKGREFILGRLVVPSASLKEHYLLQGKRSYSIASRFFQNKLFLELSSNFFFYVNILELVRIFLESLRNREFFRVKGLMTAWGE